MNPKIPSNSNDYEKYVKYKIRKINEKNQLPPKSALDDFEKAVNETFKELEALLLKKHKDYGPKNISDAPGGAMNGLLVRMHDKMARLKNLKYDNPTNKPQYESVEDTLADLANYSIIGLLVLRNKWDK